jgi:hypothetical protein
VSEENPFTWCADFLTKRRNWMPETLAALNDDGWRHPPGIFKFATCLRAWRSFALQNSASDARILVSMNWVPSHSFWVLTGCSSSPCALSPFLQNSMTKRRHGRSSSVVSLSSVVVARKWADLEGSHYSITKRRHGSKSLCRLWSLQGSELTWKYFALLERQDASRSP